MVVSASGSVKHEETVELSKKLFTAQLIEKEPTIFIGSEVRMIDDDVPLAQFAVAFNGTSWIDSNSVALMVMQTMLGSWNKSVGDGKNMGSEFTQRVEINELAESIMDFNFGVCVNQLSDTQNQFIVHQHFEESMHGKHLGKPITVN